MISELRREERTGQERAEAEITLSTEQGFAYFLARGSILRGWALVEQGWGKEGIAQLHQGLGAQRATRSEFTLTYFLALLAEAYGKVGQAEEGLTVLAQALNQTAGEWYTA
jgi:predicted ATPase